MWDIRETPKDTGKPHSLSACAGRSVASALKSCWDGKCRRNPFGGLVLEAAEEWHLEVGG